MGNLSLYACRGHSYPSQAAISSQAKVAMFEERLQEQERTAEKTQ